MPHVRTQLRKWLKAKLKGSAEAGDRVLVQRTLPLPKDLKPTFLLWLSDETSEDATQGGKQMRRSIARVVACAKGDSEAIADLLDNMAIWAERVFADDPQLGGLAFDSMYRGARLEQRGEAEQPVSGLALEFEIAVMTRRDDPATAL